MFNNIYSSQYSGSNLAKATVDGSEVRYVLMFISDGANCAISCAVYNVGMAGETQAFSACTYGDKIRQF